MRTYPSPKGLSATKISNISLSSCSIGTTSWQSPVSRSNTSNPTAGVELNKSRADSMSIEQSPLSQFREMIEVLRNRDVCEESVKRFHESGVSVRSRPQLFLWLMVASRDFRFGDVVNVGQRVMPILRSCGFAVGAIVARERNCDCSIRVTNLATKPDGEVSSEPDVLPNEHIKLTGTTRIRRQFKLAAPVTVFYSEAVPGLSPSYPLGYGDQFTNLFVCEHRPS